MQITQQIIYCSIKSHILGGTELSSSKPAEQIRKRYDAADIDSAFVGDAYDSDSERSGDTCCQKVNK